MAGMELMGNELLDIDDGGEDEDLLQHVRPAEYSKMILAEDLLSLSYRAVPASADVMSPAQMDRTYPQLQSVPHVYRIFNEV